MERFQQGIEQKAGVEHLNKLKQLANRIETGCPENYEVVWVVGSVSRGTSDQYSDVEIEFMLDDIPSERERTTFIESLGGQHITHYGAPLFDGSVWSIFQLDLLWVECGWQKSDRALKLMGELVEGKHSDHEHLILASTYHDALELRSSERFLLQKEKLKQYPMELADSIILETLKLWEIKLAWNVREALAKRADRLPLLLRLIPDCQRVLRILYAINLMWEYDYKWTAYCIEKMEIKPDHLQLKIDHILTTWDCESSLETLKTLIADVIELIPKHLYEKGETEVVVAHLKCM